MEGESVGMQPHPFQVKMDLCQFDDGLPYVYMTPMFRRRSMSGTDRRYANGSKGNP